MITLRQFKATDSDLLLKYLNDADVTQYVTNAIPQPYTLADAHWWIDHSRDCEHIKAIEYQGELVGCISATLGDFEYNRSAELGYWLGKAFWNQGIATEAVSLFGNTLFNSTNIERLFVSVVSENTASIKVLEKNGYILEGTLRKASFKNGRFYDEVLLAKLKS